jgi:hypothetical protein
MGARRSVSTRVALIFLPAVGSALGLSNARSGREPPGVAPPEAIAVTRDCDLHEVSTVRTDLGLECTASPRHFVCDGCGRDLGRHPGGVCSVCSAVGE